MTPAMQPLAWLEGRMIVTRNSDGGTSGWTRDEADRLSRMLMILVDHLDKTVFDND